MRVTVDNNLCEEHGLCAIAASRVFEMDDEGKLVYDENPDDSERDDVEAAADGCPVQAILIGS